MRSVVSTVFPVYTESFESLLNYVYDDLKGIPTFDAGIVITLGMALSLSWVHLDGVTPATHDDIVAMWNTITSPAALASDQQGGGHYAGMTSIRATRESLLSAFATTLTRFENQLKTFLPNWEDAPANAQLAALSHAWAFGGLFPATWPSWTRCFNAGEYAGAAAQDMPSAHEWALQNASFHSRIQMEQLLLKNAMTSDPDLIIGYPAAT